jgi:hypothetical protein
MGVQRVSTFRRQRASRDLKIRIDKKFQQAKSVGL